MDGDDFPAPKEGFVLTHFFTVRDYEKARGFYRDVRPTPPRSLTSSPSLSGRE